MLTDKQIADMRKKVKQRWTSQLMVFVSMLMVFSAGLRFAMIDMLCKRTGITWSQVWNTLWPGPDMNTVYIGAELKAQGLLHEAFFCLALALIMAVYAFTSARQRQKDILFLEYIDKDAARGEAKKS